MKIGIFSDTHMEHRNWYNKLINPKVRDEFDSCDVLLFAGDLSHHGHEDDVNDFLRWYDARENLYKVMIAGNHDFFFDTDEIPKNRYHTPVPVEEVTEMLERYDSITYLNNSDVTIHGIKIWGSPINKWYHDWGFNRRPGEDIKRYWDKIPNDADIVMTHGPVYGIHDLCPNGVHLEHAGDKDLLEAIERVKPKVFCCGHIHEGHGVLKQGDTIFVNASVMNEIYRPNNQPIILEIQ